MPNKQILCLDFDGVCHSYTSGWKGATAIPDPPVPGLFEFLEKMEPHFEIHVFSSRSNQPGGIDAMRQWFKRHGMEFYKLHEPPAIISRLHFPEGKPSALITIDDRALTFTGIWPALEQLKSFKPWYKR